MQLMFSDSQAKILAGKKWRNFLPTIFLPPNICADFFSSDKILNSMFTRLNWFEVIYVKQVSYISWRFLYKISFNVEKNEFRRKEEIAAATTIVNQIKNKRKKGGKKRVSWKHWVTKWITQLGYLFEWVLKLMTIPFRLTLAGQRRFNLIMVITFLRLFDAWPNFPFDASETKRDY